MTTSEYLSARKELLKSLDSLDMDFFKFKVKEFMIDGEFREIGLTIDWHETHYDDCGFAICDSYWISNTGYRISDTNECESLSFGFEHSVVSDIPTSFLFNVLANNGQKFIKIELDQTTKELTFSHSKY